jgi:hypothetical protein
MFYAIARALDRVRAHFAPRGRHRARALPSGTGPLRRPAKPVDPTIPCPGSRRMVIAPTIRAWYAPIDGTSTPLVRPYLSAHEREEKARLQRLRRDTLWCAAYGVDLDTRDIHAWLGAAS